MATSHCCVDNATSENTLSYFPLPELLARHSKYVRKVEETQRRMQLLGSRRVPTKKYELKTILKTLRAQLIIDFNDINTFYFKTKELTPDDQESMEAVRDMKTNTGQKMLANPYDTSIGDLKLYDSSTHMYRCKIVDIYPRNNNGILTMCATIELLDFTRVLFNISIESSIYNYPLLMTNIKNKEPECKLAQLYISLRVPDHLENVKIRNSFEEWFNFVDFNLDDIRVNIYGVIDGIYMVDVIKNWNGQSLVNTLKRKQRASYCKLYDKYMKQELYNQAQRYPGLNLPESSNYHLPNGVSAKQPLHKRFKYMDFSNSSAWLFFKAKLDAIEKKSAKSLEGYCLKKSLFKVTLLCWNDPNSIHIIPSDPTYIENQTKFRNRLDGLYNSCQESYLRSLVKQRYDRNELCVFKNHLDPKLGSWLRGVVLDKPKLGKCGFWVLVEEERDSRAEQLSWAEGEDVYLIQSIDFGFRCVRSRADLYSIIEPKVFHAKGAWALRCRLFGIEPLDPRISSSYIGPGHFSPACIDLMDIWIRSKLENQLNQASILFRSTLDKAENLAAPVDRSPQITLFYRQERDGNDVNINKFDCLNQYLVDEGVASSSARIYMDTHAINYLVAERLM